MDPELYVSDPAPYPTYKEVSAPDPDPVSDPANSHFIREITTIYKVFFE